MKRVCPVYGDMLVADYITHTDISAAEFGRRVGIVRQHAHKIARGLQRPSPSLALTIERVSEGVVSKEELRPDIWPPASAPSASHEEGAPSSARVE